MDDHFYCYTEDQVSFTCHIKRGGFDFQEDPIYELVQFIGYFREYNYLSFFSFACFLNYKNNYYNVFNEGSDVDNNVDNLLPNARLNNMCGSDTK